VRKRDGNLVPFDGDKIRQAIKNAVEASEEKVSDERIKTISQDIIREIMESFDDAPPDVETIQDTVEKHLVENDHYKVAKEYILYRAKRSKQRKQAMEDVFFELDDDFVEQYKGKQPDWGPIGYVTYKRTYARRLPEGGTEEYWQTVRRVVEGVFTVQKRHCKKNLVPWDEQKATRRAKKMYQLMWDFKFTPPGRGLWMMGTDYMYKRGGAPLNNCAFCSTENIDTDFAEPFCFLMDMSMLGVGVGADTKGEGTITIQEPEQTDDTHVVPDTREGWVNLVRRTLNAYVGKDTLPNNVDYSKIRPKGTPIKGFGGTASGPEPLKKLYNEIQRILDDRVGEEIKAADIVDVFNLIGKCVVAGNVRRSAEIMFGDPNNEEFLELKDPDKYQEELNNHRWASNNSIFAEVGMDYSDVAERTAKNGEPGYMWLENARKYGRMKDEPNNDDFRAMGGNPCLEQTLEPYELCCLVETYPSRHETLEEWKKTLKYAYLYAKTVTLVKTHNPLTNQVMLRNRRIGCSITGITQAFTKFGRRAFLEACDEGYDKIQHWDKVYSDWLCIPRSIKTTSIKPSGTVSLLAGVTSGIHYPISKYYIRNVRFHDGSELLEDLEKAGFPMEEDNYSDDTVVVSFPVEEEYYSRSEDDLSMWEQLENAAQIQHYWADNQVSVTVKFDDHEKDDIKNALELYETRLKGVSFLPKKDHQYEQAPLVPISEEKYKEMKSNIKAFNLEGDTHEVQDKFCDGEACMVDPTEQ
jgi:ribonucleotide reductase alpha subunit